MNIRRQLIASACIAGATVLVIFTALLLVSRQIDLALKRSEYASEISTRGISSVRAMTVDYIIFRAYRPQLQWRQAHMKIQILLATELYEGTTEQHLIGNLRKREQYLGEIFPDLIELYGASGAGATLGRLQRDVEARLVTQLMLTTTEMVDDVAQLTRLSHQRVADAQRRLNAILIGGVTILALLIAAGVVIINRSILQPIGVLRRGTETIGGGDLDHRTNINLNNELGELSKAFDAMVAEIASSRANAEAQALRLQQSVNELEAFSYSVSHDLRAPLRGIDGWSLALLEDCGETLDETGRGYLAIVRSETQRMGHLIDDLLQLSRVTRGELRREKVDMSALAQNVVARLKHAHPQRAMEFRIAPGLVATADSRLLEIVLTNLLGNAVKFTGTRPSALIEVGSNVEQDAATNLPRKVYFVRDNGVGFDMAHASKLFGAFQRMHAATEFPGTGIGLATVQRIVHRHGGDIRAEARIDQGATFYFTLGEES